MVQLEGMYKEHLVQLPDLSRAYQKVKRIINDIIQMSVELLSNEVTSQAPFTQTGQPKSFTIFVALLWTFSRTLTSFYSVGPRAAHNIQGETAPSLNMVGESSLLTSWLFCV